MELHENEVSATLFFGIEKLPASKITFYFSAQPISILWVVVVIDVILMMALTVIAVKMKKIWDSLLYFLFYNKYYYSEIDFTSTWKIASSSSTNYYQK